jgi:UDP-glucose 4-epimerase
MHNLLITGSQGYIGKLFLEKCHMNADVFNRIVAMDIHPVNPNERLDGIDYVVEDIRSSNIPKIIQKNKINVVVHLAAIISIAGTHAAAFEYDVDVNGSINLIEASVLHHVDRFIYASSGAAYGYRPVNVNTLLKEDMPILGNKEIPYSYHKYLVEEHLKKTREQHPDMEQFVFRIGTVLGMTTDNPITDYLKKPKLIRLKGYHSSFVAIWDVDLVNILWLATINGHPGIYNVAGDGAVDVRELAKMLGKPARTMPVWCLKLAFRLLHPFHLVPYGPETIKFMQYRPVLSNDKLKKEFFYEPIKNTREVFEFWKNYQQAGQSPKKSQPIKNIG